MSKNAFPIAVLTLAFLSLGAFARADDASDKMAAAKKAAWQTSYDKEILPIIKSHCVNCHGSKDPEGAFDLSGIPNGKKAGEKLSVWKRVGKRVRLQEMPPEGSPQLNDDQKGKLQRWLDSQPNDDLCAKLASEETTSWYRGYVMSRRLTRTEYRNAVRDLLDIPIDEAWDIPSDGAGGEGFDTTGAALFTSTIHVERYLAVANAVITNVVSADQDSSTRLQESREKLLGPLPSTSQLQAESAKAVIRRFARKAWRRPVQDSEVQRLMQIYTAARAASGSYQKAIVQPLVGVLISPHFLFVVETESEAGGVQRLTSHQMATRLALFLWSSIPDDELLDRADAGELQTDEQVTQQARRMLADPKARAIGENFGMQWLGLAQFASQVKPDPQLFPEYDEQLAKDLYAEAVELVADVFRSGRSTADLIDSEQIFINGNLAKHYDLDLDVSAPWQRVSTKGTDGRRGGVITLGAVLASTAFPRRTSPVLRGKWLLEEILGDRVPPAPENVPALEDAEAAEAKTLRERLELHRKKPECASCHSRMDPLGFGLENYDVLGRWREKDGASPIDANGKLPSGAQFNGPGELKKIVMQRAGDVEKHLVTKMFGFALGRELNKFDDCAITETLQRLADTDHSATTIIESIVTSFPFRHRFFKPEK